MRIFIIALFSLLCTSIFCQSVGINTNTPHASAALDITSSNGGLLIPRVDTSAISSPTAGLMVFQPGDNGFYFHNGSNWQKLGTVAELSDQDEDTYIRTEQSPDEDVIRLSAGGTETLIVRDGKLDMGNTVDNVIIGKNAGLAESGEYSIIIGEDAGKFNEGSQNIMIGSYAGLNNTTGGANTIVGDQAGLNNTIGFSNTFVGKDAGFLNEEGNTNIAIGFTAGRQNILGSNKLFVGNSAGYNHDTIVGSALMIGHSAGLNNNQPGNTFLGNYASQFGAMRESILIGEYSGRYSSGVRNIVIGKDAGYELEGSNNIAIGFLSGAESNGNNNVMIGRQTGQETINSDNVFVGDVAGRFNKNGYRSVLVGSSADLFDTLSRNNVIIGYQAGEGGPNNTYMHGKQDNVIIGERAGHAIQEDDNTIIGARAGENANGAGYIMLGRNAGRNATGGNKLYIDNTDTQDPLIYGNFTDDSLVINGTLSIKDAYTLPDSDGFADQVITTNGNGGLFWTNLTDDGDWTQLSTGLYNNTDRFAIGTSSIFTTRKLTVQAISEGTTGYFSNNSNASSSYSVSGFNYSSSATNKYGVYGWASNNGDGNRIGVFGGAFGSATTNGFGGYFKGYGDNSIGVYAQGDNLAAHLDGMVGIGTDSGFNSHVHIHKASSGGLPSMIRFTDYITGLGGASVDEGLEVGLGPSQQGLIRHQGNENIEFFVDNTKNVMTLEPSGNIKVGLSGETDQLQLNLGSVELHNLGSSDDNNGYKWAESSTNVFGFVYDGAGSGSDNRLHLREYLGTTSDIMTIKGNGQIGIRNTIPGYDLHMGSNSAAKPASSSWTVTSDARSKEVLGTFDDGLETVLEINPIHFRYNGKYNLPADLEAIGAIAQELKEVAPYMVQTASFEHEDGQKEEYLTVDYGAMDFVLINAIKDLKQLVDEQKKKIEALEKKLNK